MYVPVFVCVFVYVYSTWARIENYYYMSDLIINKSNSEYQNSSWQILTFSSVRCQKCISPSSGRRLALLCFI